MCDHDVRTIDGSRGDSSGQWPLLVLVSAPGHLGGSAASHGVSQHGSRVWPKGEKNKERGAWSSCTLGRCLLQGDSALVNPNPCLERHSSAWLSSGHRRRWHCRRLAANTVNHCFENESCCHSGSGPKSQGWLAGSSPGMQRCFHSISKK